MESPNDLENAENKGKTRALDDSTRFEGGCARPRASKTHPRPATPRRGIQGQDIRRIAAM